MLAGENQRSGRDVTILNDALTTVDWTVVQSHRGTALV